MGEVPTELAFQSNPSIAESDTLNTYSRQYDVFIETTTQMLATPKLDERLVLALEAISNSFGHNQSAIAIVNERDAVLRVRAAIGFENFLPSNNLEMPLDANAACVQPFHDFAPLW